MRDIKFRAWDEMQKVMHNNFQFIKSGDDGNDWILFTSDKQPIFNYDGWSKNPYFSQQLKVMQYTGLKDKNGKEVYEGDILKGNHSKFSRKPPVDNDIVIWRGNGWKRKSYNGEMEVYPDIDVRSMEVIGNIHENPELV